VQIPFTNLTDHQPMMESILVEDEVSLDEDDAEDEAEDEAIEFCEVCEE